jgi:hypothetical protein
VNTDSSSLIVANRSWNFQQPGGSGINTTLNVGDIIVRNINTSGSITLSSGVSTIDGSTINTGNIAAVRQVDIGLDKNGFYWRSTPGSNPITVGNIQADGITIGTTGEIMAGHLKSVVVEPDSPDFRMMRFSGIRLDAGSDIQVSSLFAKGSLNPLGETHGGTISIQQGILGAGTFQATGTIPDADLGRISTDIATTNSSGSPISIAADQRVLLVQRDSQITEGNGLERDSNGYAIYRLATNPDIRVDIVGVNPQDGGLILKNQATGEIIVGNKVVIQSKDAAIASDASGTQGLIVRLDRRNGSLVELSGTIKRQFSERPNALTVGGYYPTSVLLKTAPFSGEGFYESVSQPVPPDIQSANPIGGPLPGAYARNFGSTGPFPLTPELQTAVQKYEQTLIPIAQPSDPIAPTPTPAPTPDPAPETPTTQKFDQSSIVNATIDPTDTINLSAGAIRGAAINPGGLLKVELDTSNPEGVLTRKITK